MRPLVSYILLVAILLPLVSSWGTIAYYQLNKDYIARVLCENRDRPELHCNGQCYLAKRLKAQQDKQDKETTERVQNTPSIQLFIESAMAFAFVPAVSQLATANLFTYLVACKSQSPNGLFRPPCFC
jgi:hypothetical protein